MFLLRTRGRAMALGLPARVLNLLSMGDEARVTLDVADAAGGTLGFAMPLHALPRNGLAAGEDCTVSLLPEAIQLMPAGDTP